MSARLLGPYLRGALQKGVDVDEQRYRQIGTSKCYLPPRAGPWPTSACAERWKRKQTTCAAVSSVSTAFGLLDGSEQPEGTAAMAMREFLAELQMEGLLEFYADHHEAA